MLTLRLQAAIRVHHHWRPSDGGTGPARDGDNVYNAADDNASGSASLKAIAEAWAQAPRPARSVAFVWTTGHERGLWGARAFVSSAGIPPERIVAHVNLDMIGTSDSSTPDSVQSRPARPGEVFVIGPRAMSSDIAGIVDLTERNVGELRFDHRFDSTNNEFVFPRTDAGPWVERDVPLLAFFTGEHERYHSPQDEAPFLDCKKIQAVSRAAFLAGWLIADSPRRPRLNAGARYR